MSETGVTGGLPAPGAGQAGAKAAVPAVVPRVKKVYEVDGRDRAALGLSLGLGVLCADVLMALLRGYPGLGVAALALAWEGVLFWYAGGWRGLRAHRAAGPMTAAVVLLALDFALFSNRWLWGVNLCALPCLMVVQMYEVAGKTEYPWHRPFMLCERGLLLLEGLSERLPASIQVLRGRRVRSGRGWYVAGGLAAGAVLLALVLPLLAQADALFGMAARETLDFFTLNFGALAGRILLGALAAPPLFGVLYGLRRPERSGLGEAKTHVFGRVDPAFPMTVAVVMDVLYLLFVGVQLRALFGGPAYVEAAGLSFAEYARSGFFQLVGVSGVNLAVVLALVQCAKREGKLWRGTQALCTLMVALSAVMLCSAAWRMSLYVGLYGLSFKRALTYWGMGMLAVFFGAALLKIWRAEFRFFRVLFAASLAGWLLLNAVNLDAVVARYNVAGYLSGNLVTVDIHYLSTLSYDALGALERLDGTMTVAAADGSYVLEDRLETLRARAREETESWESWSLSAYLAGRA